MDIMPNIVEALVGAEMATLVALMAANVILSIIAAVQKKEFSFGNLGDFIPKRVGPLGAYIIVAVLAAAVGGEWAAVVIAVYVGLVAMYVRGILAAIKSITGLNIPNILSEKKK